MRASILRVSILGGLLILTVQSAFAKCPDEILRELKSGSTTCEKLKRENNPNHKGCCLGGEGPPVDAVRAIDRLESSLKKVVPVQAQDCDQGSLKVVESKSSFDPKWNALALEKYRQNDDSGFIQSGENSKKNCEKNANFKTFKNHLIQTLAGWQNRYGWGDSYNVVSSILGHVERCCVYYNELESESQQTEKLPAVEKILDSYFYRDTKGKRWSLEHIVEKTREVHPEESKSAIQDSVRADMEAKFFVGGGLFSKNPTKTPRDLKNKPTSGMVGSSFEQALQIVDPEFNSEFLKDVDVICNSAGEIVSVALSGMKKEFPDSLYLFDLASKPEGMDNRPQSGKKGSGTGGGRSALKALVLKSILDGKNGRIRLFSYNSKSTSFYRHMNMTCSGGGFMGSCYCYYENVDQILKVFPELGAIHSPEKSD